eukprot:1635546-Prymnesium_polylepis.1
MKKELGAPVCTSEALELRWRRCSSSRGGCSRSISPMETNDMAATVLGLTTTTQKRWGRGSCRGETAMKPQNSRETALCFLGVTKVT